jgi:uncharacterized phage protein (TIGR01671 family)
MDNFLYQIEGRAPHVSQKETRIIKFRGKSKLDNAWVTGGYFYIDNRINNPFNTTPLVVKHYIKTFFTGDWNMGGWEDVEIFRNTLQQFTGMTSDSGIEIYEGDVVRIYHSVSYDEDGSCTIGPEYTEGVVVFENGSFKLDNGELMSDFEPWYNYKIEVIGNVLSLTKNQTAIDYRVKRLCNNFEINRLDIYPEFVDAAFITFAKEAAQLIMDDFVCYYDNNDETIIIKFTDKSCKYVLWQNINDKPKYEIGVLSESGLEYIAGSEDFEQIKEIISKHN